MARSSTYKPKNGKLSTCRGHIPRRVAHGKYLVTESRARAVACNIVSFVVGFLGGGTAHYLIIRALSTSGSQTVNEYGYLDIYLGIGLAFVGLVGGVRRVTPGLQSTFLFVAGLGIAIFVEWVVIGVSFVMGAG